MHDVFFSAYLTVKYVFAPIRGFESIWAPENVRQVGYSIVVQSSAAETLQELSNIGDTRKLKNPWCCQVHAENNHEIDHLVARKTHA